MTFYLILTFKPRNGDALSMSSELENATPRLFDTLTHREIKDSDWDETVADPFDAREVFDLVRDINDPEHPLTLEQLNVIELDKIDVDDDKNIVR